MCDTAPLLSRIFPSSTDADADVDADADADADPEDKDVDEAVGFPGVSLRSAETVSAEDGLACLGCRFRMRRVTSGLFSWRPFEEGEEDEDEDEDDDDEEDELLGGLARHCDEDAKNLEGKLGVGMLLFAFVWLLWMRPGARRWGRRVAGRRARLHEATTVLCGRLVLRTMTGM